MFRVAVRHVVDSWPAWSGHAAAGWSAGYGALGAYWWAGGDGFPFAPTVPERSSGSILEGTPAAAGAPVMAVLGLVGTVVAIVMARRMVVGRPALAFAGFGWAMAVLLGLVVPDYTLIALIAFAPALLVFAFTGVPGQQDGIGDILYWHRVNLIIIFAGGVLWAATTLAYQRRVRGACGNCGRRPGPAGAGPSRATLLRIGRWAVLAACLAPLPYEITRLAWYFGYPLGITPEFLRMMQDTPGMLEVGLGLAVASALGGVLTHGLVRRWGEVYPRWIWFRAGRPVPPALAVVPASVVAVAAIPAGMMFLWVDVSRVGWALNLPSLLWIGWGVALGVATVAYHLRRRGSCGRCGRGRPVGEAGGDTAGSTPRWARIAPPDSPAPVTAG